jgi:hypothetical protein
MERSRNCYFFVREENPGQRSRRKSLDLQERTKAQPVFHRANFSRAAALFFVSITHDINKCDADQDASRE